jgi:hypothetical protein
MQERIEEEINGYVVLGIHESAGNEGGRLRGGGCCVIPPAPNLLYSRLIMKQIAMIEENRSRRL